MIAFAHPWLLLLLPVVLWLGWIMRAGAPAAFSRAPVTLRHPALARLGLGAGRTAPAARRWLPPSSPASLRGARVRPRPSARGWVWPCGRSKGPNTPP